MESAKQDISYDVSGVESLSWRRYLDGLLAQLRVGKCEDLWTEVNARRFPRKRSLLVTDLHTLSSESQLDFFSASPSNTRYVFLVRTDRDRKILRDPHIAQRLNDAKFHVLDVEAQGTTQAEMNTTVNRYFKTFIETLDADRVSAARFAAIDEILWVEFGDGLERALVWSSLPFATGLAFRPVTASAAEHGQSVLLLDEAGVEFALDAGALRALLDEAHRGRVDEEDSRQRQIVGSRIRRLRENAGLSQEELSKSSGIPQESLSRLENGRRDPRIDTLRKLATGLGLELSEVLAGLGHD